MQDGIGVDKEKLYSYFKSGKSIDYICMRTKLNSNQVSKYLQEYVRESTIQNVESLFEKENKKNKDEKEESLEKVEVKEEIKKPKRKYTKRKDTRVERVEKPKEEKKTLSKTEERELMRKANKEKKRLLREKEDKDILELISKGVKPTQIAEITGINVQRVRDFCRRNYSYNNYIIKAEGEENCKAIIEIKNREISYQSLKIEKLGKKILKLEEKIELMNEEKKELLKLLKTNRRGTMKIDY